MTTRPERDIITHENPMDAIPKHVIDAAVLVENWFQGQDIKRWQLLGICSRNYAQDFETTTKVIMKLQIADGRHDLSKVTTLEKTKK